MLGTAGEEAVYLWDLEEEGKVEVIRFKEEDRQRIQVGCVRRRRRLHPRPRLGQSVGPLDLPQRSYFTCTARPRLDSLTLAVHRVRRRLRLPLRSFADAHLLSATALQTRLVPTSIACSEHPPFTR